MNNHKFHLYALSRIGNPETDSRLVMARAWGEERIGSDCVRGMRSLFGEMKMFWN